MRVNLTAALAAMVLLGAFRSADAAPPTLTRLFPAGGQRGAKVEVTCSGQFDSWPVAIWAPGVEAVAGAEKGKVELTIPADLAADRIWVRLHNSEGASSAMPFLIGGLKEVADQEPNNSPQMAQVISEAGVIVNGVLEGADVDGFVMQLAAGQTLVADVDAHEIASPMDAILQIASPDGVVLAENHDDVDLDPRLAFTAARSGAHIVRVFAFPAEPDTTIAFRGGADYVYRLTLTTGPFIAHAAPLTASQEGSPAVEVLGWNIPAGARLPVTPSPLETEPLAELRNTADARLGLVFAPGYAGAARIRLAPHAVVETIASSDAANPTLLTTPTAVTGRLQQARQIDRFRLPLKKGDPLVIAVEARSLESPVQPVLRLTDPAGAVAAQVDDPAPTRATIIAHTAAHDGDYQLTLQDRFGHGGDRSFYRLTARLEEPDFELTTSADALVVAPDKPAELVINVQRRGVGVGSITIEAVDLPPGLTAASVISDPAGDSAAKVTLSFSTSGPAFSGPIRIVGKSTQPKELTRSAQTPPKLGACFETVWLTAIAEP